MARRLFNGRRFSENGWPYVDQAGCTWTDIPGTNGAVQLQIQSGPPLSILRALAADYNAYVEPLYNNDCACFTEGNLVATSNHPGGTACDFRWNSHPFQKRGSYTREQLATIQEILDFYEGTVFWAGVDWSAGGWGDPIDEMHWQMGYDTYDQDADRPFQKVFDFIARKIRADGYSTFRRGNAPMTPPAVNVLAKVMGGAVSFDRYAALAPAVSQCLRDCGCDTVPRIAMWAAQVGHESAGLRYMEEIASGAAYEGRADLGNTQPGDGVRFKGRGPIQVTGRDNYTELSQWAFGKGLVLSQTFFIDQPAQLASDAYGFIGVTWYWTTQRPMNDAADARDIVRATQYVNGGQNGLDDRIARYNRALAMGDQLLALVSPAEPADPFEEILMLSVKSMSIYATPGEPDIPIVDMIRAVDAHGGHELYVEQKAREGDQDALMRVVRTAAGKGQYGTAPGPVKQATAVLNEIEATNSAALQQFINTQKGA